MALYDKPGGAVTGTGPNVRILDEERQSVEDALNLVAEKPSTTAVVTVDGKKYVVKADGYGREIKPV